MKPHARSAEEAKEWYRTEALERLDRIANALERLERVMDEGFGAFLNARFPYGVPHDPWPRDRSRWDRRR